MLGQLVVFFNKFIRHCSISLTATTGVAFNTWRRNLTDSIIFIANLHSHKYSAKLVAFMLSIAFQLIDNFLFNLEVIVLNIYIGSSCKVFFENPNDDARLMPFSIAILVFPIHR